MENKTFELTIDWEAINVVDSDRFATMGCYKYCQVNLH